MASHPPTAPRAVIADDSGLTRRLLRQALVTAGFAVVGEAPDGDEALAQCRRHRPDVLSLDLAMPGRDGIGVLAARPRPADPAAAALASISNANGRLAGRSGRSPLVVIACSTGGPRALGELLPRLPRPRADVTIVDAARLYGKRLLLVVLTGMGKDGLDGAHAVKRAGGRILVEAESSCTVYGMPRAVSEANLADAELALHELPHAIASECAS